MYIPTLFESFEQRVARQYVAAFERELVRLFEEVEGRVPTNHEVAAYGHMNVWPDGARDILWRGKPIGRFPNPWDWAKENL